MGAEPHFHKLSTDRVPSLAPNVATEAAPGRQQGVTVSLWTPSGEHEIPRTRPAGFQGAAAPTGSGSPDGDWRERLMAGELAVEDLSPEQRAEVEAAMAEMAHAQQQLLQTPIEQLVAQHIIGLRELVILHLQQPDPDFAAAQVAIDAVAGVIDGVGTRLGELHQPLRTDLQQLQMAFVQRRQEVEG